MILMRVYIGSSVCFVLFLKDPLKDIGLLGV